MPKTYQDFALVYDSFMDNYDYEEVFDLVDSSWDHRDKAQAQVLEMACGTGGLTGFLLGAYGQVHAFDSSPDMLAQAQRKLGTRPGLSLFNLDMRDFNLGQTYDLILCLCDSINYLEDEAQVLGTLKNVQAHLDKEGLFAMDLKTYPGFKRDYGNLTRVEEKEGAFLVWDNYFDLDLGINTYMLDIFLERPDGAYRRVQETHTQYTYSRDRVIDLAGQAGLGLVKLSPGYREEGSLDEAGRLVYFFKKEN